MFSSSSIFLFISELKKFLLPINLILKLYVSSFSKTLFKNSERIFLRVVIKFFDLLKLFFYKAKADIYLASV